MLKRLLLLFKIKQSHLLCKMVQKIRRTLSIRYIITGIPIMLVTELMGIIYPLPGICEMTSLTSSREAPMSMHAGSNI